MHGVSTSYAPRSFLSSVGHVSFLVQWGDFISCLECIDHEIPELAHVHTLHTVYTYCINLNHAVTDAITLK